MVRVQINDDAYAEGQGDYARGGTLRGCINRMHASTTPEQENKAMSALFGFLDGAIASIRQTNNQLMLPRE